VSSLHRTELEVKLNGLQELMDLKKTIYEQVKTRSGDWPRNTQGATQRNGIFRDSSTTERALFQIYTKMRVCPGELHGAADNY